MQLVIREIRDDTETGPFPYRVVTRCDSQKRRWRVPWIEFSGPWRPTGPMITPSDTGAAVNLLDGRVLLIGGVSQDSVRPAAPELYHPARNRWMPAGRIGPRRHLGGAIRLLDGRVLFAGGTKSAGSGRPLRDAELYDPPRNQWSAVAPMGIPRISFAAALLPDGRVLVAGGFRRGGSLGLAVTRTAEIYDPSADSWSPVAPMPDFGDLSGGAATDPGELAFYTAPVGSGQVLVVGNWTDEKPAQWTLFDPASGSWSAPERLPGEEFDSGLAAATQLPDGRVLVVFNCKTSGQRAKAAVYGPLGWSPAAAPPACGFSLAPLPSGRALFAGLTRASIYDPAADSWQPAPPYRFPHPFGLSSGNVVQLAPVSGGALLIDHGLNRFSSAERFQEP